MVPEKKSFSCFSYMSLCKTCDPRGVAIFGPRGDNLNNLARGPHSDATYQISKPCGFREDFLQFSSCKSIFSLYDLDMQWTGTI